MNARHSIPAAFVLAIVSSVSAFAQGTSAPGTTTEPRWYVAAIGGAYAAIGREMTGEHRDAVVGYLEAKPRGKHGTHRYTAAEWGFDADGLRAELAPYMARFAVPAEPEA